MKLLVTGTREGRWDTWYWLDRWVLSHGHPTLVILGDARGVDEQARQWCVRRGYIYKRHKAHWYPWIGEKGCCVMDRAAGHKRNAEMVASALAGTPYPYMKPEAYCIALPHATKPSLGTRGCAARCKHLLIPTTIISAEIAEKRLGKGRP